MSFIGRVVKFQAEGKTSLKRAVQQTLIESSRAAILDGGIQEYNFSHPPFSDDEEEKKSSNIDGQSQNPGSNSVATRGHGGKLRGNTNALEK